MKAVAAQPADPGVARAGRWTWPLLGSLGPAFVASVAYVDPGNFATNFTAGAEHGYQLVWVIMMANLMAVLVQYLSSKAGLATGASLPELCRQRFGGRTNTLLWLQAEVIAMATDLAEFVGAAVGLNLVLGMPLLPAGLITAVAAFVILALEQKGYRRFELAIVGVRRGLTMLPSLVVLALAVSPTQALLYSQIVLSFGIPFALIPLLLITGDRAAMTDMANRRLTSAAMLLVTILIAALNLYLLVSTVAGLF